jgi:phosphatidylglycerol:prolipoprotein diacylglycerol transferase
MLPYLLKIGNFELRIYSLMYITALIIVFYFTRKKCVHLGYNKDLIENAIIWTFLGAIIGARLYYVFLIFDFYKAHPFEILAIWHGGLAIHGGLIGGAIAAIIYCKAKKIGLLFFGDLVLPFLLLGQALGRFGNFANGEAHGVPTLTPPSIIFSIKNKFPEFWNTVLTTFNIENTPTSLNKLYDLLKSKSQLTVNFENHLYILKEYVPWGIKFPGKYMSPAYIQFGSLPLHPTFFYEMILNFLGAAILIKLWKNDKNIGRGLIVGYYLIFYAIIRSFVTFFRADDLMVGMIRAPHLISIIMIIVGFIIIYFKRGENNAYK